MTKSFTLIALAVALAGCSPRQAPEIVPGGARKKATARIGMVVSNPDNPWTKLVLEAAKKKAEEQKFEFTVQNATTESELESAFDALVGNRVDGVITIIPGNLGIALLDQVEQNKLLVYTLENRMEAPTPVGNSTVIKYQDLPYTGVSFGDMGNAAAGFLVEAANENNLPLNACNALIVGNTESESMKKFAAGFAENFAASGVKGPSMLQTTASGVGSVLSPNKGWLMIALTEADAAAALAAVSAKAVPANRYYLLSLNFTNNLSTYQANTNPNWIGVLALNPRRHGAQAVEKLGQAIKEAEKIDTMPFFDAGVLIPFDKKADVMKSEGF